jgi:hypothetical protein
LAFGFGLVDSLRMQVLSEVEGEAQVSSYFPLEDRNDSSLALSQGK